MKNREGRDSAALRELAPYRGEDGTFTLLVEHPRGTAGYPRELQVVPLDFGSACVCCNKETKRTERLRGDAVGDYYGGHIFQAPVCVDCRSHAVQSAWLIRLLLIGGSVSMLSLLAGFIRTPLFFVGAAGLALLGLLLGLSRMRIRRLRHHGHHAGLAFYITPTHVRLSTSNPALAARLLKAHPGAVRPLLAAPKPTKF